MRKEERERGENGKEYGEGREEGEGGEGGEGGRIEGKRVGREGEGKKRLGATVFMVHTGFAQNNYILRKVAISSKQKIVDTSLIPRLLLSPARAWV